MKVSRQFIFALPTLALFVPLAVYLYNTVYIRYLADDFCLWQESKTMGLFQFVAYEYANLIGRGRFMSLFVMGMVMPQGYWLAGLLVVGILIAWGVALFAVIRLIADSRQLPQPTAIAMFGGVLLLLTVLSASIDPIQSVYWQAGAFTYLPPLLLFTVLVWLIMQPGINPNLTLCLCALTAFLASGFSDIFGLAQSAIFFVACIFFRMQPVTFRRAGIALIGSATGLLVVILSPGISPRVAMYPTPNLIFALSSSLITSPAPLLVSFFLNPIAVLALISFPASIAYYFDQRRYQTLRKWLFLIPFGVIALAALSQAPAFYFTSSKLPTRAWIVPQFFALCGVMAWGYTLGLALSGRQRGKPVPRFATYLGSALLVLVVASGWMRGVQTRDRLQIYASVWDKRDSQLRAETHDSTETVAVPLLPDSFELIDISNDINNDFNLCFARVYNIRGLIVPKQP